MAECQPSPWHSGQWLQLSSQHFHCSGVLAHAGSMADPDDDGPWAGSDSSGPWPRAGSESSGPWAGSRSRTPPRRRRRKAKKNHHQQRPSARAAGAVNLSFAPGSLDAALRESAAVPGGSGPGGASSAGGPGGAGSAGGAGGAGSSRRQPTTTHYQQRGCDPEAARLALAIPPVQKQQGAAHT